MGARGVVIEAACRHIDHQVSQAVECLLVVLTHGDGGIIQPEHYLGLHLQVRVGFFIVCFFFF